MLRKETIMLDTVTISQVESYSMQVLRGKISCNLPPCSRCNTLPSHFKRHEARNRTFYVLFDQFVHTVFCLITRWKCNGCGKIFTLYPPFALPYKRYTLQTIMELTKRYVDDDSLSYRTGVLEQGLPMGYATKKEQEDDIDERQLAHSTLHRWITALGGFKKILCCAQDLILQENPATTLCRDLTAFIVTSKKYRTAARKWLLKHCRQIVHVEAEFRTTFHTSIFPYLATCCAWT